MMPGAMVSTCRAPTHSSAPSWKAFTSAPPSTCTETSRGRSEPIHPSSCSSSKPFHMTMIPTPPPPPRPRPHPRPPGADPPELLQLVEALPHADDPDPAAGGIQDGVRG